MEEKIIITNNTKTLDNKEQYRMIENLVAKGSSLLLVGLNEEDLVHFSKRFKVTGIDTNEELVNEYSNKGFNVKVQNVLDINEESKYDLIWIAGSLLSLSDQEILSAVKNLKRALTTRGFIFVSHLYKFNEQNLNNRDEVNYIDEFKMDRLAKDASLNLVEYKMQIVNDENDRAKERWLNIVFEKLNRNI